MRKKIISFLIVGTLTLPGIAFAASPVKLPATNQSTCFDADGNLLSSCTATGQDGEKRAGVVWPAARFTDNDNGTVTDNLTGLIWSQHANAPSRALPNDPPNTCLNVESSMLWVDAINFVACLNNNKHAGFSDWRLPNLNELESMVNAGVADSSAYLNYNGFGLPGLPNSQVQPRPYWTSTSDASAIDTQSAAAAWDVDLAKGDSPSSTLKNELPRGVWPVRGATSDPASLWRTGQADCYDDIGDRVDCAMTGEDGEKQAGAAWPALRFKPNSTGTVAVDRLTRLTWTTATRTPAPGSCKIIDPNLDWQQALDYVTCLNHDVYLGRSDWRLPNRKELRSLVDYSRGKPALPFVNPPVFDDRDGLTYWSSTSVTSAADEAWAVSMYDGGVSGVVKVGPQAGTLPVWPVSGPDLTAPTDFTITQGNMTTKVANQTISGTVEAGSTVTASVNGVPAVVTVSGTAWNFFINPLASGENTVTVTATDAADNTTTLSPITITLDTTPSVTTATPNPGTYKVSVTVSLETAEKDSTIYYTTDGTPVSTNSPVYSAPIILTAATTATYNVQFFSVDSAGNVETTKSASYTLRVNDLTGNMKINAGAQLTNLPGVTLTLAASASGSVSSMQFSNDGVNYSTPEPYATTKSWVLNSGDGLKTVHVKFMDGFGAVYAPVTSSIFLDSAAPASMASPGAGNYAGAISVVLTMNEAGSIHYTTDGTTPTASSAVYSAPIAIKAPSTTTLRFFSMDKAGNSEAAQSLTYTMSSPDLSGAVNINNGAKLTNSKLVNLALVARSPAGVTEMQVACDGTNYASVEPFAVTRSCTLSSGDGLKTVLVKFKDGLGNWNPPSNAQITLDTTAPATAVTPVPGAYSGKVTVSLTANEAATIHYTTDGTVPTTSSPVYAVPFELAASATTTFNVQYFAVDLVGNSEQVKFGVFKLNVSNLTGSININSGKSYATSAAVTLTLSAKDSSGVTRMQFSNDGSTYTPLEPYATSKAWTLSNGDGFKTVFVRFESGTGTLYTFPAYIILSTTPAAVSNGDLNGDNKIDISDALKALQTTIGLYSPTLEEIVRGDVAPLVNGKPVPDGKIDLADTLVILQRSLELVAPW